LELLWICHVRECVERDRLFVLYSIISHESTRTLDPRRSVPVDYSKSFVEAYTRLAASAIQRGLCDELLDHTLAFGGLGLRDPEWPSWIPDWSQPLTRLTYSSRPHHKFRHRIKAEFYRDYKRPTLRLFGLLQQITSVQDPEKVLHDSNIVKGTEIASYTHSNTLGEKVAGMIISLFEDWAGFSGINSMLKLDLILAEHTRRMSLSESPMSEPEHQRTLVDTITRLVLEMQCWPCFGALNRAENDIESFHKEIARALQGLVLFQYSFYDEVVPGLTSAEVVPGDYVLFPHTYSESLADDICFVLRPCIPSQDRLEVRMLGICLVDQDQSAALRSVAKESIVDII
jgi:hypothetical protein